MCAPYLVLPSPLSFYPMELEKYKYEARLLVFKMAKLMVEAAADEDIKKEPQIIEPKP